jgi:type I restriction enzyme S subunit
LSKILIYVPSIDEQKRIVAKVDVLMELCDELEAAQQRRNSIHTAARKSAIDAISIATTPDELDLAWKRISNNWTTIADTPESIASLRLLILDLAVRGSLVEQGVIGLSAAEVTKSMRQKRQADIQLMKRSERKKDAAQSNQPQLAPSHWKKGLLGEVCLIVMGNSPPGDSYSEVERGVPLINGPVEFSRSPLGMTLRTKFTSKPTYMCKKGDILVCVRGATTGRTNIAGFDACIGRGVALVRGYESQKFINLFMWNIGTVLLAAGKGTTFPSISYDDLANLEIAIPPLDEQERLVAKVESLMDMCDELERSLHIRNELTKKIASAMTAEVAA